MTTRILVADDEDTLRSVIGTVLREDGHEVVEAASGEEAVRLFKENPCSVVITDIVMGGMTGLELLKEVRLLDPECLVIVMTSHATLDTAIKALRAGAYDFMVKPFDDISLISAVVSRAVERVKLAADNRELLGRLKNYASELETLNEQLGAMANRDGLTGLYNHRYLRESLDREVFRSDRHGHTFGVVFIDIDHFKQYNDSHGHLAGDALLKCLGRLLIAKSRRSDIVARYGGEEFVILLQEVDYGGSVHFGEKLRECIAKHRFKDDQGRPLGQVTVSLGISVFPQHAQEANALLERADRALYRAKMSGRNTICAWDEALEESALAATGGGRKRSN